ncbi:uncharacterized protein METZ01_LOCUS486396, partial [marine metagenome]
MVFDIGEISGESLSFSFFADKDQLEFDQIGLSVSDDIAVSGSLTMTRDDIYLNGKVMTSVIMSCSRCLDDLLYQVDSILKTHFVPSADQLVSSGEIELHASDIEVEVYKNQRIDLTQSVRDSILLGVPVICLCIKDCKGICFECGKNLNQ